MFPPRAIHKTVTSETVADINAAGPLAHGINIPNVKSPRTGPPNIPKIPNQALRSWKTNMVKVIYLDGVI